MVEVVARPSGVALLCGARRVLVGAFFEAVNVNTIDATTVLLCKQKHVRGCDVDVTMVWM
jgi:hypothetical protein